MVSEDAVRSNTKKILGGERSYEDKVEAARYLISLYPSLEPSIMSTLEEEAKKDQGLILVLKCFRSFIKECEEIKYKWMLSDDFIDSINKR